MDRINRKEVENLGRSGENCKSRKGMTNAELVKYYQTSMKNVSDFLSNSSNFEMSMFTNCMDHWLSDQKTPTEPPFYERGEILLIDLGAYNFGYELCYPHPCVVLWHTKHFILIAPCSTKKFGKGYTDVLDCTLKDGFTTDTGVILDNIRWCAKSRVIAPIGMASGSVLEAIDAIRLRSLPEINLRLKRQSEELASLQQENALLKEKLAALKQNQKY